MKATEVTTGLAESNSSPLPGLWHDSLHVTCGLTACTRGSAPSPTIGNEYGKTLPLPFSIQIAGLAIRRHRSVFLSCFRGVDGSCAEHLTVESYTVFICQQSYLLLFGIPSPTHFFHSRLKTFFFCKSFSPLPFFSSSGFTTWTPLTVYCYF